MKRPPAGDALVARIEGLIGSVTELTETTRGLQLNHTLWSGSRIIPPVGYTVVQTTIPMACVAIGALNVSGPVTAAAEPPADQAPTEGPGVLVVPAGWHLVAPLTGVILTVWGTAGDTVHIVAMSRLMPPSAGGRTAPAP